MLTVRILAPPQEVLLSHIIWVFIHYEAPTLYPDRVAFGKIGVQVCTVAAALMMVALKVPVLIENDLLKKKGTIILLFKLAII